MFRRRLGCLFCGRGEHELAKLVARAKAYIGEAWVAIVRDIIREPAEPPVDAKRPASERDA